MKRLVIAGGGTGGHLFPGVAVAEALRAHDPEAEVSFVGTERGIEARVLPKMGWELHTIRVSGLKTVGVMGAVRGALRIPGAILQSRRLLKSLKPDAVIGVGGYASGPVVLAARLMGIPTAILEQNSIPGLTNRILGKFARRIFLSFAHSESFFAAKKRELIGNPIRKQILERLSDASSSNDAASASTDRPLRLFVFGGSQGAVAVNRMCVEAAGLLQAHGKRLDIVHQTGAQDLEATQAAYAEARIEADCRAFIDDMAAEYSRADLILSRAGATTIAELGIVGKPAILVPYPFAANNHQVLNAQEMVEAGAARMLEQGKDDGARLATILEELVDHPETRASMTRAMASFAHPQAASRVAEWIQSAQ